MRALRLLPAGVPHLQGARRGDGLAARPHRADEGSARRRVAAGGRRPASRSVPRVPGLRNRLPVGRALPRSHHADADPAGARPARAGARPSCAPCWASWNRRRASARRWARDAWRVRWPGCCRRRSARCSGCCRAGSSTAATPAPQVPAVGPRRGRVALMTGCVQQVLRPSITGGGGPRAGSAGRRGGGSARAGVLWRPGRPLRRDGAWRLAGGGPSPAVPGRRRCDRRHRGRLRVVDERPPVPTGRRRSTSRNISIRSGCAHRSGSRRRFEPPTRTRATSPMASS